MKLVNRDVEGPVTVAFRDLQVGEVYDSQSCRGLCLKASDSKFFSFSAKALFHADSQDWACIRLRTSLHYSRRGVK